MDELTIRAFEERDRPAVLALLAESLGWNSDAHHEAFFAWKHEANPFGRSFAWVAEHPQAGVVGFRTFLRWRFERPDGSTVEAVRAVDTATALTHRGSGIFSRLTLHGLQELQGGGIEFVFNTPNDQSRPGYLKMGWEEVGRLPVQFRPRSARALGRVIRSRVPAELWSEPCDAGVAAAAALADDDALGALLRTQPESTGLRTARSPAFLRWRYAGFPVLGYRAVLRGSTVADGVALFRVRRRGPGRECALVDVVTPGDDHRANGVLGRLALRASGADHAISLATAGRARGFFRSNRLGPILTWRTIGGGAQTPPLAAWSVVLGDVELF